MPARPTSAATTSSRAIPSMSKADKRESQRSGSKDSSFKREYVPFDQVQPHDVICGRNERPHSHEGNRHYNNMIHSLREIYQDKDTAKSEKGQMVKQVVEMVQSRGGRFLKRCSDSNGLYLSPYSDIRDKISHALRSARAPRSRSVPRKRCFKYKPFSPEEECAFQNLLREQEAYLRECFESDQQDRNMTASASQESELMTNEISGKVKELSSFLDMDENASDQAEEEDEETEEEDDDDGYSS